MTPAALYSGARSAIRLARECERESLDFDNKWHDYMISEAARHRAAAAWYLSSRAMALKQMDLFEDRRAA